MAKQIVTLKDVLYGLEYLGAQLCHTPNPTGKTPLWALEPGGVKVPPHVADEAMQTGKMMLTGDSQYGENRYVWGVRQ